MNYPLCFDDPGARAAIERVCRENGVDVQLLREVCSLADQYAGSGRRHGINLEIQQAIDAFLERHDPKG